MIKLLIKYALFGIACGCVIFVLLGIWADLTVAGGLHFYNFTARALGAMVIGVGFSVSAVVYTFDRLALWLQIAINALVGFGVYFLVAFRLGLISTLSPLAIVAPIVANALIGITISLVYYLLNDREAKLINAKLKERNS